MSVVSSYLHVRVTERFEGDWSDDEQWQQAVHVPHRETELLKRS
jgi:hypothetical protein